MPAPRHASTSSGGAGAASSSGPLRITLYVSGRVEQRGGAVHSSPKPVRVTGGRCAGTRNGLSSGTASRVSLLPTDSPDVGLIETTESASASPGARPRSQNCRPGPLHSRRASASDAPRA